VPEGKALYFPVINSVQINAPNVCGQDSNNIPVSALRSMAAPSMQPHELVNLVAIESGAVRAAREAKDQKIIRSFGVTGHSGAGILIECTKLFDSDAVLTIFLCTRPDKGRYEDELLPLARSRRIGLIAMKTIRVRPAGEFSAKGVSSLLR
jgi:hypothetical protein